MELLIAPVGIEIAGDVRKVVWQNQLLIAPVGIEIQ